MLDFRGGGGWLRTSRPLLDFEVHFEVRALTPDAEPGLIVRTWTGWQMWPDRGYRLSLPTKAPVEVSRLLVGRRHKVEVVRQGWFDPRPQGEWHRVHVLGLGRRITLTIDDVMVGEFAVENHGGYVMFDNRKGHVEFRNITLGAPKLNEPIADEILRYKQLKASGGRPPEVVHEVKPVYTPEAMRGVVQGVVAMEAVVLVDGTVGPVRVTPRLDPGLDISAVVALKGWRFQPAFLNGSPVPLVVEVEKSFVLK